MVNQQGRSGAILLAWSKRRPVEADEHGVAHEACLAQLRDDGFRQRLGRRRQAAILGAGLELDEEFEVCVPVAARVR